MRRIRLLLHDIRSTHNVGAIFRIADGLGVEYIYLTGYTPYPLKAKGEERLPHLAAKLDRQIHKTALGAEKSVAWDQLTEPYQLAKKLQADGWQLVALEQTTKSAELKDCKFSAKTLLVVGNEIKGLPPKLLAVADQTVQIPMLGAKESLNVMAATAIALYHLRYMG